METINLPPFYPGQKIVALKSSPCNRIKEGHIYTAAFCVKECKCGWNVGIRELPANFDYSGCFNCNALIPHTSNFFLIGGAQFFSPIEEIFQPISLEKVVGKEWSLISAN